MNNLSLGIPEPFHALGSVGSDAGRREAEGRIGAGWGTLTAPEGQIAACVQIEDWIRQPWLTVTVNASCTLQLHFWKLLLFSEESAFRAAPQEEMIYIFWQTPRHYMHHTHTHLSWNPVVSSILSIQEPELTVAEKASEDESKDCAKNFMQLLRPEEKEIAETW